MEKGAGGEGGSKMLRDLRTWTSIGNVGRHRYCILRFKSAQHWRRGGVERGRGRRYDVARPQNLAVHWQRTIDIIRYDVTDIASRVTANVLPTANEFMENRVKTEPNLFRINQCLQ